MKSYASVERREDDFIVCEVEMISVDESKPEDFIRKDTTMYSFHTQEMMYDLDGVEEGDILVVEHDGDRIDFVYRKDEHEKQRRIEIIQQLLEQI